MIWRIIKFTTYGLIGVLLGGLIYLYLTFPDLNQLKDHNPETTAMIETRAREARERGEEPKRIQVWVPLEKISPNLQRAVLAGEDTNFATHHGFDYEAIRRAWEQGQKETEKEAGGDQSSWLPDFSSFRRGGSTISQQLAKNLYLSSERSITRKLREAVITYFMERRLSKHRILEIYLNVIEWGDGIYGAEAAAQTYFHKSASALTTNEAAFLSAMIPSPLNIFNPQKNPRRLARRQKVILRGMPYVKMPEGTG
ncbi:MAG TPA: transglycosylase domain-containing protein [Pyrinomonadaceae bacterium]|jgi:monofunctional biosynthetic peptidoglycan transglycosylase|nr:transglycosylase domain-containing protein [Pyrinomonadaceae bacterium]